MDIYFMINDDLYEEYLMYLDWRLNESQISKGKYALLKMSRTSFDKFVNRLETDESFNKKIVDLIRSEIRDQKIEDIIEEEVEEKVEIKDDFFDDLDDISTSDIKIDDIFDDLDF